MRKRDIRLRSPVVVVALAMATAFFALVATSCSSASAPAAPPDASAGDGGAPTPEAGDAATVSDGGVADAPVDTSFLAADAPPPSITPASLPAQGTYLGAFVDVIAGYDAGPATDTDSEQRFVAAEELIRRKWVIDNRFYDDSTEFVSPRTQWDKTNQIIPMITWMPYGSGNPLVEIIEGVHDAAIHAEAQKAKALGVQLFMRWGHEMNGNWYPWGGYVNGSAGDADGGVDDGGGSVEQACGNASPRGGTCTTSSSRRARPTSCGSGARTRSDVPDVAVEPLDELLPGGRLRGLGRHRRVQLGLVELVLHLDATFATLISPARPIQDYAGEKTDHASPRHPPKWAARQGGLDQRRCTRSLADRFRGHPRGRLVRHQQRDRLAHRLVAFVARGVSGRWRSDPYFNP